MLRNYDPEIPDDPISEVGRLRRISKLLRLEASGDVNLDDPEKIKQYKQLLFSAAKQVDEAAKILPENNYPIYESTPWWVWGILGAFTTLVIFLTWVAYMRFVNGTRIGFINEMGL